ncbi:lipoprotein signal peptidase II, LspA, putative [Glycocaulis alkaliphilus]|uniref:Lipoprotein signal peptidase n=1 Tax=Glycocaulis alkaliphilus TaxID=1434191 RepID=A0A3T0E8F7_9PROT|nr:signal peptidase II [Glycocaulis alkaliphilus]AZU03497.1 lipoprotein signal peptidase II, LspA, putative [Glycocaulis alkaliphilus]GGB73955.1 lipoprotein signal peptidase [Glycocaulis alkaliphilus]
MSALARYIPSTRLAAIGAGLAVLVIVLDQASKLWVLHGLGFMEGGPGTRIEVLDPWFNLTMVWNRGVSFGLFAAESLWTRLLLIGFSLAIAGVIAFWLTRAERKLQALAFGLIIGGAVGNVIDRIAYGAVADFLDFSGLWFPYVFNVADAAISVGVAGLVLDVIVNGSERKGADAPGKVSD